MPKQVKIIRKTHLLCYSNKAVHKSLQAENLTFPPVLTTENQDVAPADKSQTLLPQTRNQRLLPYKYIAHSSLNWRGTSM